MASERAAAGTAARNAGAPPGVHRKVRRACAPSERGPQAMTAAQKKAAEIDEKYWRLAVRTRIERFDRGGAISNQARVRFANRSPWSSMGRCAVPAQSADDAECARRSRSQACHSRLPSAAPPGDYCWYSALHPAVPVMEARRLSPFSALGISLGVDLRVVPWLTGGVRARAGDRASVLHASLHIGIRS